MLGLFFGDNGHRNGRKDRRSKTYRRDDSDSDSDYEATPDHKVSRFVGDVAEHVVQPFEMATKLVMNPVHNLLFSPPPKRGNKGRQGQYHGGQRMQHHGTHHGTHGMQHHGTHGLQHHGTHGLQHHDRFMSPQAPPP